MTKNQSDKSKSVKRPSPPGDNKGKKPVKPPKDSGSGKK